MSVTTQITWPELRAPNVLEKVNAKIESMIVESKTLDTQHDVVQTTPTYIVQRAWVSELAANEWIEWCLANGAQSGIILP